MIPLHFFCRHVHRIPVTKSQLLEYALTTWATPNGGFEAVTAIPSVTESGRLNPWRRRRLPTRTLDPVLPVVNVGSKALEPNRF
jgi:hypothetical protein